RAADLSAHWRTSLSAASGSRLPRSPNSVVMSIPKALLAGAAPAHFGVALQETAQHERPLPPDLAAVDQRHRRDVTDFRGRPGVQHSHRGRELGHAVRRNPRGEMVTALLADDSDGRDGVAGNGEEVGAPLNRYLAFAEVEDQPCSKSLHDAEEEDDGQPDRHDQHPKA